MLKELFHQLFQKLQNEPENDKKSKNGNAVFFVEEVLENRFNKINYVSSKTIKCYYDRFVEGKHNYAGEPGSELKGYIANYLGYSSYLDFESKHSKRSNKKFASILKWTIPLVLLLVLLYYWYLSSSLKTERKIEAPLKELQLDTVEKQDTSNFKGIKSRTLKEVQPEVEYKLDKHMERETKNSIDTISNPKY